MNGSWGWPTIWVGLICVGGVTTCTGEAAESSAILLEPDAAELHRRVLTIDSHDDIPFDFATDSVDPGVRGDRQVDLPKMREGELDAGFFVVYVEQTERTPENYEEAQRLAMVKFNAIHRMTDEMYPNLIELARTVDDVTRIHRSGKLVAAIGIENGYVIGTDLSLLETYYDLGARYMTLAHGGHNDIADSATPRENLGDAEVEHDGISDFGAEVIAEMNRLGIMVDISHVSKAAMMEAVELSAAPVIASHSSTRALADHPRNMDDEQLLALMQSGGVIQIVGLGAFVKVDSPQKTAAFEALRQEMGIRNADDFESLGDYQRREYDERARTLNSEWPAPSVRDFVDHIDHAVQIAGIDHVGISSDFDGGGGILGWQDASESANVTAELLRRGYSEDDIAKLWGGNLLRVWRRVERVAAEMRPTV